MRFNYKLIILIVPMAMFLLAGCDPVTGKTLFYGNLKVVNEYTGNPVTAVYLYENKNSAKLEWRSTGNNIAANGGSQIFTDVPAGKWRIGMGGREIDDVVISMGMITTVTRDSGGNLVAGIPLP